MTKSEAVAQVNFQRVQPVFNRVPQKLLCRQQRELLCESQNDCLLDPENTKALHLLIPCVQQWRSGLGMENCARMWIERDHGGDGANCPGSLNHGLHDQLVAQMETI